MKIIPVKEREHGEANHITCSDMVVQPSESILNTRFAQAAAAGVCPHFRRVAPQEYLHFIATYGFLKCWRARA